MRRWRASESFTADEKVTLRRHMEGSYTGTVPYHLRELTDEEEIRKLEREQVLNVIVISLDTRRSTGILYI